MFHVILYDLSVQCRDGQKVQFGMEQLVPLHFSAWNQEVVIPKKDPNFDATKQKRQQYSWLLIAPENKPSQKESILQTIIFQGLC